MADVFISFIHEEERVAIAVQAMLREKLDREHRVFLSADTWQIRAGEIWLDRLREELDDARVAVLLLSPSSIIRPWVNFEAGAAWLTGKAIIPVCFGGLLKEQLPKPYSNFQAIALREEYYYLVRSVFGWLSNSILPLPFGSDDPTVVNLRAELDRLEDRTA
jgi:hypothetical protein